jgi:hypothetical protein
MYLVFAGEDHEERGGVRDLAESFESRPEAVDFATALLRDVGRL